MITWVCMCYGWQIDCSTETATRHRTDMLEALDEHMWQCQAVRRYEGRST